MKSTFCVLALVVALCNATFAQDHSSKSGKPRDPCGPSSHSCEHENQLWQQYLKEHHKKYHDWEKASKQEQKHYREWRDAHADHDAH